LASADIKGYIHSGAGSTGDYHALDINVYGDNQSVNKGISIFSRSSTGAPAETVVHGYLGIGTTDPASILQVGHTATTSDTVVRFVAGDSYKAELALYGASQGTGNCICWTNHILWRRNSL
jgi:hypothetical protein